MRNRLNIQLSGNIDLSLQILIRTVYRQHMDQLVFIGAGRVAVDLSHGLATRGFRVTEVCNRSPEKGIRLANSLNARYIPDPEMINPEAGSIIIAVADDAIPAVCKRLGRRSCVVVHTSGSQPMHILSDASGHHGVLYPLQTFGGETRVEWNDVPVFLEASDQQTMKVISRIAKTISDNVQELDSDRRAWLHLAAVFAHNFPVFMYSVAEDLLHETGMEAKVLMPLIRRSCHNLPERDFFSVQTGPAVRNDVQVISRHTEMLRNHPDYRELYELISRKVIKYKMSNG